MSTTGYYGERYELLMGVQADQATENTTAHVRLPARSVRPNKGSSTSTATLLGQGKFLPDKTHFGLDSPVVDISVPADPHTLGYHLTGLFGEPQFTAGTPNVHTWLFNESAADPFFYTLGSEVISRAGTRNATRYGSAIYNSMNLALAKAGAPLDVEFGLLALRTVNNVSTHDASPTVTAISEELRQMHSFVRIGGDVDTLTQTVGVTAFNINVSRGLAHDHRQLTNSGTALGYLPGTTVISGSMNVIARDFVLRDLAAARAPVKLNISLRNGSAAAHLLISTELMLMDPFDFQAVGRDIMEATVNWRIQQPGVDPPGAGANILKFELFNTLADYADFVPA